MSAHLMSAHLMSAHLMSAHLMSAHLMSAHLMSAHLMSAVLAVPQGLDTFLCAILLHKADIRDCKINVHHFGFTKNKSLSSM